MRVLAFDVGYTVGFAALGGGKNPAAGSFSLPGNYETLGVALVRLEDQARAYIKKFKPTDIALARPFVHPSSKFATPNTLGPLFGFDAIVQLTAERMGIPCHHANERGVRAFFLKGISYEKGQIKQAVQAACRQRRWNFCDEHAADALAVAAYTLSVLSAKESEEAMPLAAAIKRGKNRGMDAGT